MLLHVSIAVYTSQFSLEDSFVPGNIDHLMHLIKVRLEFFLAVFHPLSKTRSIFEWIHSTHPELAELTHSLKVSNGDLVTVNELVILQKVRLEHVLGLFQRLSGLFNDDRIGILSQKNLCKYLQLSTGLLMDT